MFYDKFKALCDEKGVSCTKAAMQIGLSNATPTKWKKTGATPDGATLSRIAEYFGVSIDSLLGDAAPKKQALPALTDEDKQDIAKRLEDTLEQLMLRQEGLMFDGEPLDDMTRELLETSLRNSMELAKRMSKAREAEKRKEK